MLSRMLALPHVTSREHFQIRQHPPDLFQVNRQHRNRKVAMICLYRTTILSMERLHQMSKRLMTWPHHVANIPTNLISQTCNLPSNPRCRKSIADPGIIKASSSTIGKSRSAENFRLSTHLPERYDGKSPIFLNSCRGRTPLDCSNHTDLLWYIEIP